MHVTITIVECRGIKGKSNIKTFVRFYRRGAQNDDQTISKTVAGNHPIFRDTFTKKWDCRPDQVSLVFEVYESKTFSNVILGLAEISFEEYLFIHQTPKMISLPIHSTQEDIKYSLLDQDATLLIQITPEDWGNHGPPYVWMWSALEETPMPELKADISDVVQVVCSAFETFFLTEQGQVLCCELKDNEPTQIIGISNVVELAAGSSHLLFVTKDSSVFSLGHNKFGQLGVGDLETREMVARVLLPPGMNVKSVYAASEASFLTSADGRLWACGNNTTYQLGLPNQAPINQFTMTELKDVNTVTTFNTFSIAICNGAICFSGRVNNFEVHHWMHIITGRRFISVSGGNPLIGISKEGRICQIDPEKDEAKMLDLLKDKKIVQLATGNNVALVLDEHGVVYSFNTSNWKSNNRPKPIQVMRNNRTSMIAAGGDQCVAVTTTL